MKTQVRVPTLPESIADATVAGWHKRPGEAVRRDENLVDLETDKVVLEVPAPADGVLVEIHCQEGELVQAEQVLALIEAGAAAARQAPPGQPPDRARADGRDRGRTRGGGGRGGGRHQGDLSE